MPPMRVSGIGLDVAEVARFRLIMGPNKKHLLYKMFSSAERKYCLSYKDAATHFAGTFAAKEAVQKAHGDFSLPLVLLEIRREKGKPAVWIGGKRMKEMLVSITHTRDLACAIALKTS